MSVSATWQVLPNNLLQLVLARECSLAEASELLDLWLMTPDGGTLELPPRLYQLAAKLHLFNRPTSRTRH